MSYSEIIVVILSFLSVLISLFAIWLAIIFYRLFNQFSLMVTEMSKGLDISTIRLERLPKILYNEALIFSKESTTNSKNIVEKENERNPSRATEQTDKMNRLDNDPPVKVLEKEEEI